MRNWHKHRIEWKKTSFPVYNKKLDKMREKVHSPVAKLKIGLLREREFKLELVGNSLIK